MNSRSVRLRITGPSELYSTQASLGSATALLARIASDLDFGAIAPGIEGGQHLLELRIRFASLDTQDAVCSGPAHRAVGARFRGHTGPHRCADHQISPVPGDGHVDRASSTPFSMPRSHDSRKARCSPDIHPMCVRSWGKPPIRSPSCSCRCFPGNSASIVPSDLP